MLPQHRLLAPGGAGDTDHCVSLAEKITSAPSSNPPLPPPCARRARSQSGGSGPRRPGPLWTLFIRQRLRSEHWCPNPSALCDGVPAARSSQLARSPQGGAPIHPFGGKKKEKNERENRTRSRTRPLVCLLVTNGRAYLTNGGAGALLR